MANEIRVDTNELDEALNDFFIITGSTSTYLNKDTFVCKIRENCWLLSDDWKGDTGSQFVSKLYELADDAGDLYDSVFALQKYCKKVKDDAEKTNNWLDQLCSGFTNAMGTLANGTANTINDIFSFFGL